MSGTDKPTHRFDLSAEPWLPSLGLDGKATELGLKRTLADSHILRELADLSPLVNSAALCLLLAILYDCWNPRTVDDFEDHWKSLWEARRFPNEDINLYFARRRDRFDLFDPAHPFYQTPDLEVGKFVKRRAGLQFHRSPDPVTRLLTEAASGHNAALFDHRADEVPDVLTPPQAARALLVAQAFALGFGQASAARIAGARCDRPYSADAPLLRGITIWLSGDTLFETLLLNYTPYMRSAKDCPAWDLGPFALMDRPGKTRAAVPAQGRLDQLTWQSRLVRLLPEADDQGQTVIRQVYFTQGRRADRNPNHPMKTYRRLDPKAGLKPIALSASRAAWRDSHALFRLSGGAGDLLPAACILFASEMARFGPLQQKHTLGINIAGIATKPGEAAKFLLWRQERIPLPHALLQDTEGGMLRYVEDATTLASNQASSLLRRTRRILGFFLAPDMDRPNARQPDANAVKRLAKAVDPCRAYWPRLEEPFHRFLRRLGDGEPGQALQEWRAAVSREAATAFWEAIESLGSRTRAQQAVARSEAERERQRRERAAAKANTKEVSN